MGPSSINIDMAGDIEEGDTERLIIELAKYDMTQTDIIRFYLESPGGSLVEGLELGWFISSIADVDTYSLIGRSGQSGAKAICASACVYAFLGAEFRSMHDQARLGVHKFYTSEDGVTTELALSAAQSLSGEIIAFLMSRNIDVSFFDDILRAEGGEIYWVPRTRLQEVRAINDGLSGVGVSYENSNGALALLIEQNASVGANALRLTCIDGLVGIAFLMEPPDAFPTEFFVSIGGEEYFPEDTEILARSDYITTVGFAFGEELTRLLAQRGSLGAGYYTGPYAFYGFRGEVSDPKIAEMAQSCPAPQPASARPEAPNTSASAFIRGVDVDIAGGDLTRDGIRGISMDRCEEICLSTDGCVGVSYVPASQWCWPKSRSGYPEPRQGVISSVIE